MESKAAPTAPAAAPGAATTAASASGRPPTSAASAPSAEAREAERAREAELVRAKAVGAAIVARLSAAERDLEHERADAARLRAELEALRGAAQIAPTAPRAPSATGTARSRATCIPWSHLLLQRREQNRAIKAE